MNPQTLHLVDKKDRKIRFCIDYQHLNKVTKKDAYPLPSLNDILNTLGNAKYYSTVDLSSAFWSIPISKEDREKTAFISKYGLWQWINIPFGLTNAPATQQRFIEKVLDGMLWDCCMVYVDDIVIFFQTEEEHIEKIKQLLQRL